MANPNHVRAPRHRNKRHRPPPRKYRIGEFIRAYAVALAACFAALLVNPVLALIAWPIAGLFVSRFVSQRVTWWLQSDNLANVSSSKLSMVLRWPLAMPALIFRMIVVRYL